MPKKFSRQEKSTAAHGPVKCRTLPAHFQIRHGLIMTPLWGLRWSAGSDLVDDALVADDDIHEPVA